MASSVKAELSKPENKIIFTKAVKEIIEKKEIEIFREWFVLQLGRTVYYTTLELTDKVCFVGRQAM